ncbi:DUF2971 domain-containing protein [Shewanella woodyi]|uniref:DUF2971 domain-containing protein n=1 Tax=Shewanella woodyi TaxID=60961 RepID=UPI003749EA8B
MYKPEISRLYHYQSIELELKNTKDFERRAIVIGDNLFLDKYKLDPILKRQAYFSKATTFNDPFEGVFALSSDVSSINDLMEVLEIAGQLTGFQISDLIHSDTLSNQLAASLQEHPQAITKSFTDQIRQQTGLYCLTADPEDMIMWAHYGSNHSGIALEFDRTPESNCGTMTFEVDYFTSPPEISFGAILRDCIKLSKSKSLIEKANLMSNSSLRKLLYSKTSKWKYESEWRTSNLPGLQDMPGKLVSIIFGYNVKLGVIEYLKSREELKGVSFKCIHPDKSNYKLKMYDEDDITFQVQRVMESIP